MMSIFDTARLTDIGSKTGYRILTSLKMSRHLLIHHSVESSPVYLFWYMYGSDNVNLMTYAFREMQDT